VSQLSPFRLPDAPARPHRPGRHVLPCPGQPTRLRIPQLPQAEDELAAGELTRQLAQPQPGVSDHLACLRWRGSATTRHDVAARCRIHEA
jgi:Bacterial regulatory protein, arsR family